jgi:hypothetical protein
MSKHTSILNPLKQLVTAHARKKIVGEKVLGGSTSNISTVIFLSNILILLEKIAFPISVAILRCKKRPWFQGIGPRKIAMRVVSK